MNVVITGASRGIGFETAKKLASLGARSIVAISRNEMGLKDLKNACIRENVETHLYPIVYDLSNIISTGDELVQMLKKHVQHVDILINNAGLLINKPFVDLTPTEVNQMLTVNFTAAAQLVKLLLPMMGTHGHVINISSMGGFQGSIKFPGLSVYSASKAALASLTECLAEELKHTGIAFNSLALGAVNTEMQQQAFPDYQAPVNASEMGAFIATFALNGQKMFNGKIIPVSLSTP